jgi:ribonucleoside-diphosphate reductase alpha chain
MVEAVRLGTLFLLAGTVYSHLPYEAVHSVRSKNRRLGLGLMGVHEWLLKRGKAYAPDQDLARWLDIYAGSDLWAARYAAEHGLTAPVKTRAIAPTGTIGIIAETTTGIEPIFAVAYRRRYKTAAPKGDDRTQFQYVVDPTAKRLVDGGVDPGAIEDAYTLSFDVRRRVEFQAWVQRWVDHGISSTINLPYPITDEGDQRDFGEMLLGYLPRLRGITCYPDGARGGQPLSVVPYGVAVGQEGVVFEEDEESCINGVCGV